MRLINEMVVQKRRIQDEFVVISGEAGMIGRRKCPPGGKIFERSSISAEQVGDPYAIPVA